jgi:cephalosporin hydroxylase
MARTTEVLLKKETDRFINIETRNLESDLPELFWRQIAKESCYVNWKGIPMQKGPFQIITTQQLIQELKPKTIIEFGTYKGGSALWLADLQQLSITNGKVISIDINLDNVSSTLMKDPRIEFLQGDSNDIQNIFPKEKLTQLMHPILLIEDAHINTIGILDYFHKHSFKKDDYFIVEDTNKHYNEACYYFWQENLTESESLNKLENLNNKILNLQKWLSDKDKMYLLDAKYLDPFGIKNASKNWNSIVKRVK